MFGETDSESPRMPSPWEALASSSVPSPAPSPLALGAISAGSASTSGQHTPERLQRTDEDEEKQALRLMNVGNGSNDGIISAGSASQPDAAFPKLAPEIEEGNVEYKLKLVAPTPPRFTRLVTQLKYRLLEGGGQALYEIGVGDSGELIGLSRKDLEASLDTLDRMAGELGATIVVLKEIELPEGVGGHFGTKHLALPRAPNKKGMNKRIERDPAYKTKKERDKEARRNRRAAALLVGEVTTATIAGEITSPRSGSGSPSGGDSGVDLSATIVLDKPAADTINASKPMPIIRPYPYGRQPFALRHKSSRSVESNTDDTPASLPDATESTTTGTSLPSSTFSPDDLVYHISSSADSQSTGDALGKADADDAGDDAGFGFGFDLEIASFAKGLDLDASPPNNQSNKPLHYSSFSGNGTPNSTATPPSEDSQRSKKQKAPGQRKKPIIPSPPPMTPAEKATERRQKRDARREQRKETTNADERAPDDSAKTARFPQVIIDAVSVTVDDAGDSGQASPSDEDLVDGEPPDLETGPKVIAEVLVVRKLALEEAFLDFGGFGLVAEDPTLADDDEESD